MNKEKNLGKQVEVPEKKTGTSTLKYEVFPTYICPSKK